MTSKYVGISRDTVYLRNCVPRFRLTINLYAFLMDMVIICENSQILARKLLINIAGILTNPPYFYYCLCMGGHPLDGREKVFSVICHELYIGIDKLDG